MSEEEKQKYEAFKYWIETNTEKGVSSIPDYLCNDAINLIEKQQKEIILLRGIKNYYAKNNIPKQKIKDKLEEINREFSEIISENYSLETQNYNAQRHNAMVTILEELLEEV